MTRHRTTRTLTALALLASSLAVGVSPTQVRADDDPTLPEPIYEVFVNTTFPGTPTTMAYTGAGSWTNVELADGTLAAPLFKMGADKKVPHRSAVIVSNLAGATKVRAAVGGLDPLVGERCPYGLNASEQAALTVRTLVSGIWKTAQADTNAYFMAHEGEEGCMYLTVDVENNVSAVMFVVDLYCRNGSDSDLTPEDLLPDGLDGDDAPECEWYTGAGAGGANMKIEVEGSGDGVFNTGFASNGTTPARGDEAFEVLLSTNRVETYTDEGSVNGFAYDLDKFMEKFATFESISRDPSDNVTFTVPNGESHPFAENEVISGNYPWRPLDGDGVDNRNCFSGFEITSKNDISVTISDEENCVDEGEAFPFRMSANQSIGLLELPTCAPDDPGPCVEDIVGDEVPEDPEDPSGWSLTMLDQWGTVTIRPWRNAYPFHLGEAGSSVNLEYTIRIPKGEFRSYFTGTTAVEGLSIAFSSARIQDMILDDNSESDDYVSITMSMAAEETTTVSLFNGNDLFFADECSGQLFFGDDGPLAPVYQDGDETTPDIETCEGESADDAIRVIGASLWPSDADEGPQVIAWVHAPGHEFAPGNTVTICCIYGLFDGTHEVIAVGNPYDEDGQPDWFAFVPNSGTALPFPEYGLGKPYIEDRLGWVVKREFIRVTATTTTLDLQLRQPWFGEEVFAGGYLSTNAQALSFGDGLIDDQNPAYDFALAGPSTRADGTSRENDGFFRACVPETFIDEVWNLTPQVAVSRMALARNGSPVSSGLAITYDELSSEADGCRNGALVQLSSFGFSVPYFRVTTPVPQQQSTSAPAATATTTTTPPASPTTTTAPAITANTIPPNRIPGQGRVVAIPNSPPPGVADAVGMKVSSNGVTLALNPTATSVRRGQTYEVTLVGPDGKRRTFRIRPRSDGRNVTAAFQGLPPGEYQVVVRVRNRNGKYGGRWASPPVAVRR